MSGRSPSLVNGAAERAGRERDRRRQTLTPLLDQAAARNGAGVPRAPIVPEPPSPPESPAPPEPVPEPEQPAPDPATTDPATTDPASTDPASTDPPDHAPPAAELPPLISEALDFLARRLGGDYTIDEFGLDADLTSAVVFRALRPVYRHWFRVDVRGAENIPDNGAALLVSNHSGTLPWDALMTQLAVFDVTPSGRILRPLGADLVFATPVVGDLARRMGATLAATPDAERLLAGGELVGVWPEGFKGIGKLYRDRYRLARFGRGGFVAAAIRAQVPIIPVSVVGAEETYPMLADVPILARLMGTPYWPVTPTWPWLGPLGLVPMPSKWIIEFGAPIATDSLAVTEAEDPLAVIELTDHVRDVIQRTLYALLVQRGRAFG